MHHSMIYGQRGKPVPSGVTLQHNHLSEVSFTSRCSCGMTPPSFFRWASFLPRMSGACLYHVLMVCHTNPHLHHLITSTTEHPSTGSM